MVPPARNKFVSELDVSSRPSPSSLRPVDDVRCLDVGSLPSSLRPVDDVRFFDVVILVVVIFVRRGGGRSDGT